MHDCPTGPQQTEYVGIAVAAVYFLPFSRPRIVAKAPLWLRVGCVTFGGFRRVQYEMFANERLSFSSRDASLPPLSSVFLVTVPASRLL